LSELKVLDFGQYIAGPLAAMLFCDQGAAVTHIDPPGGPRWADPAMAILNRGKHSLELDLSRAEDRARALSLVAEADLLIENFRPGVMARLGLDAAACHAVNPGLVYLSLPGFASGDPEFRGVAAWEAIIGGAVGQFRDMGLNRVLMGVDPSYSPLTLASAYGGVLGAVAAMTALAAGERGRTIEVPLATALLEGLVFNALHLDEVPERYLGFREREIGRRRQDGIPFDLSYDDLQELLDPFYRSYRCADGRPFYVVAAGHAQHPEKTLRLLGIWQELVAAGLPLGDAYAASSTWPAGQSSVLAGYPLERRWAERVSRRMAEILITKPAFEWERRFGEAGIPGAAHRRTTEWLASEHPLAAGLLIDGDSPTVGRLRQPGPTVWFFPSSPSPPEGGRATVSRGQAVCSILA
jgi:crotonobetainyl-CoA:carnitine CoA-transferase CaiB-like acyl-CoA transferase